MARPRTLDIDRALETATELFWRYGYEGTSLADLTAAMGVTPPSFYLAFENKEGLFRTVLERYRAIHLRYGEDALRQPTARAVAEHLLYRSADAFTDPSHPPGCLAVNSALPCPDDAGPIPRMIAAFRDVDRERVRQRFEKAKADGDLPPDADPDDLARYIMTVGWGMATEAQAGANRAALYRTAAMALKAWPG